MIEDILLVCLYLLALAFVFWLVVLVVIPALGLSIPPILMHILMVMFLIVALIIIWRAFGDWLGSFNWRLRRRPPPTP